MCTRILLSTCSPLVLPPWTPSDDTLDGPSAQSHSRGTPAGQCECMRHQTCRGRSHSVPKNTTQMGEMPATLYRPTDAAAGPSNTSGRQSCVRRPDALGRLYERNATSSSAVEARGASAPGPPGIDAHSHGTPVSGSCPPISGCASGLGLPSMAPRQSHTYLDGTTGPPRSPTTSIRPHYLSCARSQTASVVRSGLPARATADRCAPWRAGGRTRWRLGMHPKSAVVHSGNIFIQTGRSRVFRTDECINPTCRYPSHTSKLSLCTLCTVPRPPV
ncbi:hypothetical protein C2E23DRAFT_836154 [Lenzites betulinus]|nr:hypothetical protein C2E23DRAFT_836127 [Lenzites betulinus]KAH9850341.1 hypothetical protein C2E23DRAFT_836154 [Lenzites betulinus]